MVTISPTEDQLGRAVHQHAPLSRTGLLERLFSRLFHGLVYAQIWEDPVVDMEALGLGPADHVVCIASGGCNAMCYLTRSPASLTVVDLSPAHVALLKLKLAAARHFGDHDDFHALFARADLPSNPARIARLAPHLDAATRAYWTRRAPLRPRSAMFARNFYRYGVLGRFIGFAHLVSRLGRVDYAPFLAAPDLAAQRAFFEARIAPLFETRIVRFLAHRRASLFGLGIPPAQYDKLARDGDGQIIPVLRERLRKLMCDFPVGQNYFAWAAFNRGYARDPDASLPPYLQPANFAAVKAGAARVAVHNRALTDLLRTLPGASRTAYVLLDAQDWMTDAQLGALWTEITRTAAPGATVVFRTGGTEDILPGRVGPETLDAWRYDAPASERGFAADRSAIYGGFHVYRRAA